MGQTQDKKTLKIINYYLFQKEIEQYLTNWNDKNDKFKRKIGYLVNPDWVTQYKKLINYSNIKFILDQNKIKSTKYVDDQELVIDDFIKKPIKSVNIKSINLNKFIKIFKFEDNFLSLETLQNFMNKKAYNGMNGQQINYIFKKKMLILFFDSIKILKIIYFYEKEKKIINLKFIFYYIKEYNRKVKFFVESNIKDIEDFLNKEIFVSISSSKEKDHYDTDLHKDSFKIIYEEEIKNSNDDSKRCYESTNIPDLLNNEENKGSKEKEENKEEEKGDICQLEKVKTIKKNDFNDLVEQNKIFAVNIITPEQNHIAVPCNHNQSFNDIEKQLYEECPEVKKDNIFFIVNGKVIDRKSSFEKNNIKAGDKILMKRIELEKENDNN